MATFEYSKLLSLYGRKRFILEFDTDLCDIYNFIEPEEVFEYKLTHSTLRLNQYTIVFVRIMKMGPLIQG